MSAPKDLRGQRFGRLVALEPTSERKHKSIVWRCLCDCGNTAFIQSDLLNSGNTQSCGCIHREQLVARNSRHSYSNTRLYKVFKSIKNRCYNPKNKSYKDYGGRGITVCDEWRDDFAAFYAWAMAHGYDENAPRGKCTIDRIDVNDHYSPGNCRFVDMKTQANNKRNSKKQRRIIMEYTVHEQAVIGCATAGAFGNLESALDLMDFLYENYFMYRSLDALIEQAKERPEFLSSMIFAILNFLRSAKIDLDTFNQPDSLLIENEKSICNQRQAIINTYLEYHKNHNPNAL